MAEPHLPPATRLPLASPLSGRGRAPPRINATHRGFAVRPEPVPAAANGAAEELLWGQPIDDPPPVIEPLECEPAVTPTARPARPVRRLFLAPAEPVMPAPEPEPAVSDPPHELVSEPEPPAEPPLPALLIDPPSMAQPPERAVEAAPELPIPAKPAAAAPSPAKLAPAKPAPAKPALLPPWWREARPPAAAPADPEPPAVAAPADPEAPAVAAPADPEAPAVAAPAPVVAAVEAAARVPLPASPARESAAPQRGQPMSRVAWRPKVPLSYAAAAGAAVLVIAGVGVLRFWSPAAGRAPPELPPALADVVKPEPAAPDDPTARAPFYLQRAKAGDAQSQLELAILYARGDGVPQDYAQAAAWFRKAADQGMARAQYDLGVLLERGRGVPVNYAEAFTWYSRASEANFPLAQYNLAVAYTRGQGTRQDFVAAAGWYQRAATQGVVPAMVNLAILYERGEGVKASVVDAYAWYRAAAQRGNELSAKRAPELMEVISGPDRNRAQARAATVLATLPPPGPGENPVGPPATLKSGIEPEMTSTAATGKTGGGSP